MRSMVELLSAHAVTKAETLFVADDSGREYTYSAAWEAVRRAAFRILQNGEIQRGDRIMVECNQDVSFLLVDFACELIGAVFVPFESNASDDRKRAIREETGSVLLVSQTTELKSIKRLSFDRIFEGKEVLEEYEFPASDDLSEILYTTGTTGVSKGIALTNRANIALAENIRFGVGMKPENRELIPVPISHSHGLRCCYANLLNGGSIILTNGLMAVKKVFSLMARYRVTAMDLAPSAAALLIKLSKGAFWEYGKHLDYIQIGTASLPEGLKEQLINNLPGVRLYNFYGSTESGRSCVLEFSKEQGRDRCIGKPTVNSTIYFTDSERQRITATADRPGLLASSGPMNMSGYWKNPALTNTVLCNGCVFTNDLGYMDEDGFIYLFGRNDDVINYNGIKISPEEIEDIAVRYPGVKDAACVPVPDTLSGQVPKLFLTLEDENDFEMKSFLTYLSEHIDANKMPKSIECISSIPRSSNGKILRRKLIP